MDARAQEEISAWVMGLNSTLGPDQVIGILKTTARDLGPTGPDQFYGWGRIDFGAAAAAAIASLPRISGIQITNGQVVLSASFQPGLNYLLWRTPELRPSSWEVVTNFISRTNASVITLADPSLPATRAFYRIQAAAP